MPWVLFRTNASEGPCSSRSGVPEKRPTRYKRDMTALLTVPVAGSSMWPSKRGCKEKALQAIVMNHSQKESSAADERSTFSLHDAVKYDTDTIGKAVSAAPSYIQKNASFVIQKAFSIVIMSTAATIWGFKLSEAADKASDVTGYLSKTIYQWTTLYMNAVVDTLHVDYC